MPLSNTTANLLASYPYWDDFVRSKHFHRLLIKPRLPIQTRELNQIQSMLQNQIERLGSGIFKEGSAVVGGNFTFANNVMALQVVRNDSVDIANFYDESTGWGAVVRGATSTAEGRVVQVDRQTTEDYSAVVIAPMTAVSFQTSEGLSFIDLSTNSSIATMTSAPLATPSRSASTFSVEAGVFFLRGFLMEVDRQSLVLSTSTSQVTARLGFLITETIITKDDDTSLLDPALGSTNYAAPGGDRLVMTATLTSRPVIGTSSVEQNSDENFIEIARVIDGVLVQPTDRLVPALVEDTMARRTYDESGDYVVRPFRLSVKDHNPPVNLPNMTGTITGITSSLLMTGTGTRFTAESSVGDSIIVNGESREVASILSDTQLTVTSYFGSAFTDAPFVGVSPNKLNLELDAGKAYVRGYEFETLGTTKLTVDRPRTTGTAMNENVGTFFGPYVYVTRANGALFNINTMEQVHLHSVPFASINAVAANTYLSTHIGTAYVRDVLYHSGNGDANTIHKMFLVNLELQNKSFTVTGSTSSDTALTGLAVSTNTLGNYITLSHNAAASNRNILPTGNDAFCGSKVSLFDINGGALEYWVVDSTSTTDTSGGKHLVTNVLRVASNAFFNVVNATGNVSVAFTDKSVRGMSNSSSLGIGYTVSDLSKEGNTTTGNTVWSGTDRTSLIFPYHHSWIDQTSIADESYQTVKYFTGVTGTVTNGTHSTYTLTVPVGMEFHAEISTVTNFAVTNSTNYFVPLVEGTVNAAISSTQAQLFIPTAMTGTNPINVYARVDVNVCNPRTKSLVVANTSAANVETSGANLVANTARGHIAINVINATSSNVVSLGVADVLRLQKVYAVSNATNTASWVDVTDRYTLDNGQRDWVYDHSSLVLKPGMAHHEAGRALVMVDLFTHSSSNGYFTGESYISSGLSDGYTDIPTFTDPKTGATVVLRDSIDFRPVRTVNVASANSATNPYVNTTALFDTQLLPYPDGTFISDHSYYLPRIDKVVVTKSREFKAVTGSPSLDPKAPADVQDGITLYVVSYPPYVSVPSEVQSLAYDYRRYTMRDIGRLEKRIENLEYYVQLSLLEHQTLNTPEFDQSVNAERFKNGILVDPFGSYAVADASDPDYAAALDVRNRQLRPAFDAYGWSLGQYLPSESNNTQLTGNSFVTLAYTTAGFVKQPLASKAVSINPFGMAVWTGVVELLPSSDVWFDNETRPDVSVNLYNENDNWLRDASGNFAYGFGTTWNDWELHWHGEPKQSTETERSMAGRVSGHVRTRETWTDPLKLTDSRFTSARTTSESVGRSSAIVHPVGDRSLDVSVSPYIRALGVAVVASGLQPGTPLLAVFDEVDVTGYVDRANEIRLTTNAVAASFTVGETVTSNGTPNGTATVIGITGNVLRVADARGSFFATGSNVTVTGASSLASAAVSDYVCASGRIQAANSTTITLDTGASPTTGTYVGNTVFITSGTGAGSRGVVTAYNGTTKIATISPVWATTPAANGTYSIGSLVADNLSTALAAQIAAGPNYLLGIPAAQQPGRFFGYFRIPASTFLTGRRVFRLTDAGPAASSNMQAEGVFAASGYTRTNDITTISTRDLEFTTIKRSGSVREITDIASTNFTASGRYADPLAQTFMVDDAQFAQGVFVTSVDLFFAQKDQSNFPVSVQIRPTINGQPSADKVIAQAQVLGNDVQVVPSGVTPNPDTATHRTRFTFSKPVYLQPGVEYALVVLSNSPDYQVFVGEMGQQIIGDVRLITHQPYKGSFFKSQNARTWTAEQSEDMMFVINRAVFSTDAGYARFKLDETTSADFDFDVINLQTGHTEFPSTLAGTSHELRLTTATTNALGTFVSTEIEQNSELDERKRVRLSNTTCVELNANMHTENDAVSPVYDLERLSLVTVKNLINNGELDANGFVVVSQGVMVSNAVGSYPLTLTCATGSGSTVYANTNSTGYVVSFYVAAGGSGYADTPTVTFSNTAFSTQPTFKYTGETSPAATFTGDTTARYITRKVTLADGFDASDLKVYLSLNRPTGTNVDVYYKILASGDTEQFAAKPWVRMTMAADMTNVFTSMSDFRDFTFGTVGGAVQYVSNGVTYNRFHTFAIKVVLRSEDSTMVPRAQNIRVIAFDD